MPKNCWKVTDCIMDVFERDFETLRLRVRAERIGADLLVSVSGGDLPHIGSVAIAEPDQLRAENGGSATVSTYNVRGHREGEVATEIAKRISAQLRCRVVVICGFHYDRFSADILSETKSFTEELVVTLSACFGEE